MSKFSRRRFLQVGTTAAAAAVAAPSLTAQDCTPKLPPAIASLKSWKDQAVPISVDERKARVERARELMVQNKLQAIAVAAGSSLPYYSGVRWWTSERFFAMILPAKGKAFFVCPAFEEGRAREQISMGPFGADAEVRIWQENEDPYQRVADGLKDLGITTGVAGHRGKDVVRLQQRDGFTPSRDADCECDSSNCGLPNDQEPA